MLGEGVHFVPTMRPLWLTDMLEEEVELRILRDPRTVPGTFLGWPKDRIFQEVLGWGQADFDLPIGHLVGADRALLYARYNQPRHLDELEDAFTTLFMRPLRVGRPTLIDLGCGPFTAGLALATSLGSDQSFRYYGIDRSTSMLSLGEHFAACANNRGAFHPDTTRAFGNDLDAIDFGPVRGDLTLVVASYLLASPSVDVNILVATLLRTLDRIGPGPVAVLYTNSALPRPNMKYPDFRNALLNAGFSLQADGVETFYKTKNPKDLRYALYFRQPQISLKIK